MGAGRAELPAYGSMGNHGGHEARPCEHALRGAERALSARPSRSGHAGRPVLLIRLGYTEAMPASYRRPLDDVIRESGDPS